MPKVSVCCSVYNQASLLIGMIESVLAQTYKDFELIILCDGLTEDVQNVVSGFHDERIKFRFFRNNKGIPHGINAAFEFAQGEYIVAIAADERFSPDKLEVQVKYLEEHPELDAVFGLPCNGDQGKRPEEEQVALAAHNRSNQEWVDTLLAVQNVPLGSCTALFRRNVIDSIGYMDSKLKPCSDLEWFVRFFKKGHKAEVIPYRVHHCVENPHAVSRATPENMEIFKSEIAYVRQKHRNYPVKFTVAVPAYNAGKFIAQAIQSVKAQTETDYELLVLNDGSTDNTEEVIQANAFPQLKYFKFDENRGKVEAVNQMLARAEGEFFAVLAADDVLDPDYLAAVRAEFENEDGLEFCASQTDFIDADGKAFTDVNHPFLRIEQASNKTREQWLARLWHGNVYFGAGTYRTEIVRASGGWDKNLGVIDDYEMYVRLLNRGNIKIIERPLTHTRIHGGNMSLLKPQDAAKLKTWYGMVRKRHYPPRPKVIIATPFYNMQGFAPYITSMVATSKMLMGMGINFEFWELSGDSYVHRARNTICAKFLEDVEATDLFFIDSDESWNPEAIVNMLSMPEEMIGGSYPQKNDWDKWTSNPTYTQDEKNKSLYRPTGRVLPDGSALIKADTLAAGFLRIRRSALEKFAEHYKDLTYKEPSADPTNPERVYTSYFECERHDGLLWGEDRTFCRRWKEMGGEMWIYTNINMGHYGIKGWYGNFHRWMNEQARKAEEKVA